MKRGPGGRSPNKCRHGGAVTFSHWGGRELLWVREGGRKVGGEEGACIVLAP